MASGRTFLLYIHFTCPLYTHIIAIQVLSTLPVGRRTGVMGTMIARCPPTRNLPSGSSPSPSWQLESSCPVKTSKHALSVNCQTHSTKVLLLPSRRQWMLLKNYPAVLATSRRQLSRARLIRVKRPSVCPRRFLRG